MSKFYRGCQSHQADALLLYIVAWAGVGQSNPLGNYKVGAHFFHLFNGVLHISPSYFSGIHQRLGRFLYGFPPICCFYITKDMLFYKIFCQFTHNIRSPSVPVFLRYSIIAVFYGFFFKDRNFQFPVTSFFIDFFVRNG